MNIKINYPKETPIETIQFQVIDYLKTLNFIESCTININMYCIIISNINKTSITLSNYLTKESFLTTDSLSTSLMESNIKVEECIAICNQLTIYRSQYPVYIAEGETLYLITEKLIPDFSYVRGTP